MEIKKIEMKEMEMKGMKMKMKKMEMKRMDMKTHKHCTDLQKKKSLNTSIDHLHISLYRTVC